MNSLRRVATVIVLTLIAAACGSDGESAAPPEPPPSTSPPGPDCVAPEGAALDIPYATEDGVDATLLSLDIYSAAGVECGTAPVVVFVHGGGWRKGDKGDTESIENKRALAAEQGWVLVSVNHRLSDADDDPPVQYPDHPVDVSRAIAFIQDDITGYGGDPERVVLMGHSSGAGIVTLLGAEPAFVTDAGGTPPACIVALDTEAYDVTEAIETGGEALVSQYELAFGTDPAVWVEASPIEQLDDGEEVPAFLLVARGGDRRVDLTERFGDAVTEAGGTALVVRAPDYDLEQVDRQLGVDGETVITPPIVKFVDACAA